VPVTVDLRRTKKKRKAKKSKDRREDKKSLVNKLKKSSA
jgi:hypothetical protein